MTPQTAIGAPRRRRCLRWLSLASLLTATAFDGCWASAIALRFREGYAPGFIEGFTTAVLTPGDWEVGLRRSWAALFEGLGAIVTPRGGGSTSGNSNR
ncbi:MAG: hypothetical protein L6Q92_10520 [Phycisphaerae bacterium]|nr:hypothetical protein [Phycisphaerae bacterium]